MGNLIRDIFRDPGEYEPVLFFLGVLLSVWSGLLILGVLSLRRAIIHRGRPWLTISLALIPLLLGTVGVLAQIPLSLESGTFKRSYELRWMFIVPLVVGGLALVSLVRRRRRHDGVS